MPSAPPDRTTRSVALDRAAALERMRPIMGWFTEPEAELLLTTAGTVLWELPPTCAVVEVGSYYGRSTVLLASAMLDLRPGGRLIAIDPHDGVISLSGRPDQKGAPTFEAFCRTLTAAGVRDAVEIVRERSTDVVWDQPIGLLFVDGLHDYDSVRADFDHFDRWILPGGFVAFHDCSEDFPGVVRLVDEVDERPEYGWVDRAGDLVVLRKYQTTSTTPPHEQPPQRLATDPAADRPVGRS